MQPTMKLRWHQVYDKRAVAIRHNDMGFVLQQWWEEMDSVGQQQFPTGKGEWRDIPLEAE